MYKETKFRSVLKSVSWRFWATVTTFTLVFIFTGKLDTAIKVGGIEVFLKMFIYFLHERVWGKVKFGRHEVQPFVVWLTGLSGSGKTSVGNKLTDMLEKRGYKTEHLDGETVRDIFPDAGFSKDEVNYHIKRVGYLASKLENKGVFVVASFLSPYKESRDFVKELSDNFIEVHINTPLEVCEKRQNGELYEKARRGEIQNLPGVDVPYEAPEQPDIVVDTSKITSDDAAEQIFKYIKKYL